MLVEDFRDYISAATGLGISGVDLFAYKMPATPEDIIVTSVLSYFGGLSYRTYCGTVYERARFQVLTRGVGAEVSATADEQAWARAYGIYKLLDKIIQQSIAGCLYIEVQAIQAPFVMRRDGNERIEIATNFEAMKVLS